MDDTWVKIRTEEVESFTEHVTAADNNIKFTQEVVRGDSVKETEASTQRSILAVRLSSAAGAPAGDHQNQAVSTEAHQGGTSNPWLLKLGWFPVHT